MSSKGSCLALVACSSLFWSAPIAAQNTEPYSGIGRLDGGMAPIRPTPVPICFPPPPPPLGRPVPKTLGTPGRNAAPEELAPFVNDPFYPQLSTRLLTRSLTSKLRQEVDEYLKAKRAAQAELRAELERVRDAEPEPRRQALVAFAKRQTPRLAELEKTAEKLRLGLAAGGQGWDDLREWHLTDNDRRGFSPVEIAQVVRSYAYYRAGLSPGQRRLLREIALELLVAGDSTEKATANQPYVFFQPELARITLPADVPPELGAKIASYQTKKALLKKELFDAVRKHDGARLAFLRNPLRSLADKHAAGLAELETLADAIRAGLAEQPADGRSAERSPLPPALTERLTALLRARDAVEHDATLRIEALLKANASLPVRVPYRFDGDGMRFIVIPHRSRGMSREHAQKIDELRASLSEIAEDFGRRMAELVNERDAIRREAGEAIGSQNVTTIDAALGTANRLAILRQNEGAYREYRVAAFEPGLSPEQRRLLLDAAITQLNLPLPRAEMQPIRRASSW